MTDRLMVVKFVFPENADVSPFAKDGTFTLEDTTHCITINDTHYVAAEGCVKEGNAIRHYLLPGKDGINRRHGIGIVGAAPTLRLVGAMTVDPPDGHPVQAAGMWVAEPQG